MSQVELIQKKKLLTFEEICPEWSNHLAIIGGYFYLRIHRNTNFTGSDKKFYDLGDASCCIVGEAWKGNSYTGLLASHSSCSSCFDFSMRKFMSCSGDEEFEQTKQDFVNHFNEVHVK